MYLMVESKVQAPVPLINSVAIVVLQLSNAHSIPFSGFLVVSPNVVRLCQENDGYNKDRKSKKNRVSAFVKRLLVFSEDFCRIHASILDAPIVFRGTN